MFQSLRQEGMRKPFRVYIAEVQLHGILFLTHAQTSYRENNKRKRIFIGTVMRIARF